MIENNGIFKKESRENDTQILLSSCSHPALPESLLLCFLYKRYYSFTCEIHSFSYPISLGPKLKPPLSLLVLYVLFVILSGIVVEEKTPLLSANFQPPDIPLKLPGR